MVGTPTPWHARGSVRPRSHPDTFDRVTGAGDLPSSHHAGWYPDPTGRYEYRYHNGRTWTADVSTDGQRYVDSSTTASAASTAVRPSHGGNERSGANPGSGGNGMAIAGLTCGILSISFGWIPVVFVLGAVLAVLGVVFGSVGLRRSASTGSGRGFALAGIVTGAVGVAVAIGGLIFTVAVFRALERYENPVAHRVEVVRCAAADGVVVVAGELRNDHRDRASFTVRVDVARAGSGVRLATTRAELTDVAPGDTVHWELTRGVAVDDVQCSEPVVDGPLPFGIDPG